MSMTDSDYGKAISDASAIQARRLGCIFYIQNEKLTIEEVVDPTGMLPLIGHWTRIEASKRLPGFLWPQHLLKNDNALMNVESVFPQSASPAPDHGPRKLALRPSLTCHLHLIGLAFSRRYLSVVNGAINLDDTYRSFHQAMCESDVSIWTSPDLSWTKD